MERGEPDRYQWRGKKTGEPERYYRLRRVTSHPILGVTSHPIFGHVLHVMCRFPYRGAWTGMGAGGALTGHCFEERCKL
eukprot:1155900-Rhodomonas_salina.1